VNILSTLARLQDALGRADLAKQMVLVPPKPQEPCSAKEINLLVGYNGSPCSQTALDLTLWIAHQTRLATGKQVTVQVVYVLDTVNDCLPVTSLPHQFTTPWGYDQRAFDQRPYRASIDHDSRPLEGGYRSSSAVAEPPLRAAACQLNQFDQADLILWQARHLADEWRGSLKTHLRFGQVATELQHVSQAESAALLLLGCDSVAHPLVQQLKTEFPCAILGIPPTTPSS
jgi:hypothetical protein